jgi:hypothetical protein
MTKSTFSAANEDREACVLVMWSMLAVGPANFSHGGFCFRMSTLKINGRYFYQQALLESDIFEIYK